MRSPDERLSLRRISRGTRKGLAFGAAVLVLTLAAAAWSAGTPALIKMNQPADPEMTPAVFKHWKHQRNYKCFACHPSAFSKWEKAVFDHDAMEAGNFCGMCHDGKIAFDPNAADVECEVCHVE